MHVAGYRWVPGRSASVDGFQVRLGELRRRRCQVWLGGAPQFAACA
jgi:hypothetical protein